MPVHEHAKMSQLIYEFSRTALLFKIPSEVINPNEATTYTQPPTGFSTSFQILLNNKKQV